MWVFNFMCGLLSAAWKTEAVERRSGQVSSMCVAYTYVHHAVSAIVVCAGCQL